MRSQQEIEQALATLIKSRDQLLDARQDAESSGNIRSTISYKQSAQEAHKTICTLLWVLDKLDRI